LGSEAGRLLLDYAFFDFVLSRVKDKLSILLWVLRSLRQMVFVVKNARADNTAILAKKNSTIFIARFDVSIFQ
jgi:hypothetical protein